VGGPDSPTSALGTGPHAPRCNPAPIDAGLRRSAGAGQAPAQLRERQFQRADDHPCLPRLRSGLSARDAGGPGSSGQVTASRRWRQSSPSCGSLPEWNADAQPEKLRDFRRSEDGSQTVQDVIVLPMRFTVTMMTFVFHDVSRDGG